MSKKLEGKIALIAGGSAGIGLATAKEFVKEGAYVYITGRRQPELDAAVASIGSNIKAIQGAVTKCADLDRIYAQMGKEKGRLDILFAIAGGGPLVPLAPSLKSITTTFLTLTLRRSHSLCRRPFR
jgi:NAD(P)-dependent dehydrogenase (short-subunit alcohol dehydrogenase family)